MFRRNGDLWTLAYDDTVCRLPDTPGLRHLACLLRQPGRCVEATDLIDAIPLDDPSDAAETPDARERVARSIRTALLRISQSHHSLGLHLRATVRTGATCSYSPDPRVPIVWQL